MRVRGEVFLSRLGCLFGFSALLLVTSCSETTGPPRQSQPDRIVVSPSTFTLVPEEASQLTATVLNADGDTLRGRTVVWASSSENTATVSSSGLVTASQPGTATITASVEDVRGDASVSVVSMALREDVAVIDSTQLTLVADSSERAEGTLRFEVSAGGAPSIEPGDVIVGAQGGGFLRRVQAATTSGNTLTLTTTEASLSDVVKAGSFAASASFGPGIGSSDRQGQNAGQGPVRVLYQAPGVDCQDGVCVLDGISFGGDGVDVGLSGKFEYNLDVGLEAELGFLSVNSVRAEVVGSLGLDMQASLDAEHSFNTRDSVLIQRLGRTFYAQIGPVPVVGAVTISFYGGYSANASVDGNLLVETEGKARATVGAEYDKDSGWDFYRTSEVQDLFDSPSPELDLEAQAGLRAFVRPKFEITLYTVAGGWLAGEPYLAIDGNFDPQSWRLMLAVGLDGEFGLALRVLRFDLASYHQRFNVHEWVLIDVQDANVRLEVSPSADTIPVDGTRQFSVEAFDPDGIPVELPEELSWSSSDETVAMVDTDGIVQAVDVGEARIIVSAPDAIPDEAYVTVADYGALEVITQTTGEEFGPENFIVVVDDKREQPVGLNGNVIFEELVAGNHTVELAALTVNCAVEGENPRTVPVPAEGTVTTTFDVTCTPETGDLKVSTITTGQNIDPDGYIVVLDETEERKLDVIDEVVYPGIQAGVHLVELIDVAGNCSVAGDNPRTVNVPPGEEAQTDFEVTCEVSSGEEVIVYAADPDQDRILDIYAMNPDGSDVRKLVEVGFQPRISPDGSKILYWYAFGGDVPCKIFVMDADGSNSHEIPLTGNCDRAPAWAPDGERFVFISADSHDNAANHELYIANLDGTGIEQLTDTPYQEWGPSWSKDGLSILYSAGSGGDLDIYRLDLSTGDEALVRSMSGHQQYPVESPGGSRILFSSQGGEPGLYSMMISGSDLQLVYPGNFLSQSWSPNGDEAVTVRDFDSDEADIVAVREDGTDFRVLAGLEGVREDSPDWGICSGCQPAAIVARASASSFNGRPRVDLSGWSTAGKGVRTVPNQ